MSEPNRISGVLSPVVTPFDADLRPNAARLVAHSRWLLANDVGLAVFGTNSEANSLTTGEKRALLEALIEAGLPAARMMPGTGYCALPDSVEMTRHAVESGCGGVLMLPPFYYKGVSEDGLYRNFAEVIERVGDARLRVYLYHIPPVAQVPIPLTLIERLLKAYPGAIAGVKDSGGDWSHTETMIREFGPEGFDVFAGSEPFLLRTMRAGGAGCISATANVNPGPIAELFKHWRDDDADARQAALTATRKHFEAYVVIPALKAAIAHFSGDDEWNRVRPPLMALNADQRAALASVLTEAGFDMPGLAASA